jgi:hypothetical protein
MRTAQANVCAMDQTTTKTPNALHRKFSNKLSSFSMKSILFLLLPSLWFGHLKEQPYYSHNQAAVQECDSIPPLNQEIIAFVDAKMRKKVGNGQCWTLAAQALDNSNATWNGKFEFGTQLNPDTDCIYPGDIIQFKNVKLVTKNSSGGSSYEEMEQHTAIVYKVVGKGHYQIAHQNTEKWGKKVDISTIDLKNKKKGKIWMYRPTR